MTTEELLKTLAVRLNISIAEMARVCGKSPQAFSQKMKRNSFTTAELKEIATILNCKYVPTFILPDGKTISDMD